MKNMSLLIKKKYILISDQFIIHVVVKKQYVKFLGIFFLLDNLEI